MKDNRVLVGIVFNVYKPQPQRDEERVSEESLEQVAQEVHSAITTAGYSAVILPLKTSLIAFLRRLRELGVDILINLCEGFNDLPQLEANVAAAFELLDIPFTGNSSRTLALCQDKFKAKAILNSFGLPVTSGRLITSALDINGLSFPLIVKPNFEDASIGIYPDSVVTNQESLIHQVERIVHRYRQPALVEEYIEGREFNVAVLEEESAMALPVSEIDFSQFPDAVPKICSYEAKWFEDHFLYHGSPPICPAPIDDSLREQLQDLAVRAFQAVGCRDYARVDFRMGRDGRILILEVNPNPDISLNAGYARALKACGIPYEEFWRRMIDNALRRKRG